MRVNTFFNELVLRIIHKVFRSVAAGEAEGENGTRYHLLGHGNPSLTYIFGINTLNFGHIAVPDTQSLSINRIHPNSSVAQITSRLRKHIQTGTSHAVLSGNQNEFIAVLLRSGKRRRRNIARNRSDSLFGGFVLEALESIDFDLAARRPKGFVIRVLVIFLCLDR